MYIRKIKSRGSTCFQIGRKRYGKFVLLKHVGCTSVPSLLPALKNKAQKELKRLIFLNQLSFWPDTDEKKTKAQLLNWKITGFHRFFGPIYDLVGFPQNFLRDLTVARIVYPKSKLATARYLTCRLSIPTTKDKIYRFMDKMSKAKLTKIAYGFIKKKNQKISLVFYDVTTLYFEIEKEDRVRRKGYSKDHRHDMPQILIGLFVDKDGYPFDYDFFEGKTFEGHTFKKAVKSLLKKYSFKDLTVVADAGMLSHDNLSFLEKEGLFYIVAARLKNLKKDLIERVLSHDYLSNPFYERRWQNKKFIVGFCKKRAKRDKQNRNRLIKTLKLKLNKKQQVIRKSKYLKVSGEKKILGIDQQKIKEDQRFDGLKGYFTNHKFLPATQIAQQYRNLWQVEKAFRMSKNDLKERPVFHQKNERVASHLLLCFCSLLVAKEAERQLSSAGHSLARAIEILSSVGEGEAIIGKFKMPIEKKLGKEAKQILNISEGH